MRRQRGRKGTKARRECEEIVSETGWEKKREIYRQDKKKAGELAIDSLEDR